MVTRRSRNFFSLSCYLPFLAGSCLALAIPRIVQAQDQPLTFEVAAIHAHRLDDQTNMWRVTPNGFSATNLTLRQLIFHAYDLKTADQLMGLPAWSRAEHIDVEAKMNDETSARFRKLSQMERVRQSKAMLQALLADRFTLQVHHETRNLAGYQLISEDGKTKLEHATNEKGGGVSIGSGQITGSNTDLANLAFALSSLLKCIVVDKTGITGHYDFVLKWPPEDEAEPIDLAPSIITALKEQIGLKMVSTKLPADVIVVDHVERASPN
jgi:uncharacterized protein (TIGR03435 family)